MTAGSQLPSAATAANAEEPFIGKVEAARRLACGKRTLDRWMKRGVVPFYKVFGRVVFRWSEIEGTVKHRWRVEGGKS